MMTKDQRSTPGLPFETHDRCKFNLGARSAEGVLDPG